LHGDGNLDANAGELVLKKIERHGRYIKRYAAEADETVVQVIPSGILTYRDDVFVFRRKETDSKYRLYGKTTILHATHVSARGGNISQVLEDALCERIARTLFLGQRFPMTLKGYCWDRDEVNSRKHLAVIYDVRINSEHTAADLRQKEFRNWRGPSLGGEFVSWDELDGQREELNLEPWSQAILDSQMAQQKGRAT
jgi:predicted NUDIX family phosphoesterase